MRVRVGGLAAAVLSTCFIAAASAGATTISAPGLTTTVTAAIKPTRLPADDTAPVTLALDASLTRSDTTCLGSCHSLRLIDVRLDRQVNVDTEGLPTCQVADVKGSTPAQARRKCGRALIGIGSTSVTTQFVEVPPFTVVSEQLFFNAGKGGKVLMYTHVPQGTSSAGVVGTIRNLKLRPNDNNAAAAVSFHFAFGKTWSYRGEKHSYLNGQCRTGVLKQEVTLELADGSTASDPSPVRCAQRAG